MRITVLASGSRGNATLVEAGGTRLMIDAGISARAARRRAREVLGIDLQKLDAVVLTHAHGDHMAHACTYADVFGARLYATEATRRCSGLCAVPDVRVFGANVGFEVGPVSVTPEPVSHDAPQVALVLEHAGIRAAIVTDLGEVDASLVDHLRGCAAVLVESNHDEDLLANGPYPTWLKQRVASAQGHLSNAQTAELLRALGPKTTTVVLMHLSQQNNRPDLARGVASDALDGRPIQLLVASQTRPLTFELPADTQPELPWADSGYP